MTSKVVRNRSTIIVHKRRSQCGDRQRRNIVSQTTLTSWKSTSYKLGYDDRVQTSFTHSPIPPRTAIVREADIYIGIANPGFFSGGGIENVFFFVICANPVSKIYVVF